MAGKKKEDSAQQFDYAKAVAELERIATIVEDPKTSLDDIDKYMKSSKELIAQCREYLRTVRENIDSITTNQ